MSLFELYFRLGVQHIADLKGYAHILFIFILCAVYSLRGWRRVVILVTAFTMGHSLTLAMAKVLISNQYVSRLLHYLKYSAALFLGLIPGLGFSNYLRRLPGPEKGMLLPLISFNLGIE